MLIFLLNNWKTVLFGMTVLVLGTAAGYYKWQANRWEGKYEDFVVETRAAGLAAEIRAKETKARDEKAKEVADANYRKSLSALRADNQRLHDERASRQYLPPAAPGAGGSDTTCLATADAERAIRDFVEATGRLVEEGDEARAALDNARAWAQR